MRSRGLQVLEDLLCMAHPELFTQSAEGRPEHVLADIQGDAAEPQ